MRVLLIYPPHKNLTKVLAPGIISRNYQVANTLPLGILYLAAYLKSKSTHEIQVWDLRNADSYREVEEKIRLFNPEIAGISTQTANLYDALKTAATVKGACPEAKVILGGLHANYYPLELSSHDCVDYVIQGYGEVAFDRLVSGLHSRSDLTNCPNLFYKEGQNARFTPARDFLPDLDALPFPDRSLLNWKDYSSLLDSSPSTSMVTSRGCPFNCIYCSNPSKTYRERSPANIGEEIRLVHRQGYRTIHFWDETFNITEGRVLAICEEITGAGLDLKFGVKCRVDKVTEPMVKSLKQAGCERISFGIESSSQKTLDNLRHEIILDDAVRAVELAKKARIQCSANFILGCPGEGLPEAEATIKFARRLSPDYAQFALMTVYPGTKLLEMAIGRGMLDGDEYRNLTLNPRPLPYFPIWEEKIQKEQLVGLIRTAYFSFYFRFSYILKRLIKIRSLPLLWKNLKGALSIVAFIRKAGI